MQHLVFVFTVPCSFLKQTLDIFPRQAQDKHLHVLEDVPVHTERHVRRLRPRCHKRRRLPSADDRNVERREREGTGISMPARRLDAAQVRGATVGRVEVARAFDKTGFFGVFPMFVPSLSW